MPHETSRQPPWWDSPAALPAVCKYQGKGRRSWKAMLFLLLLCISLSGSLIYYCIKRIVWAIFFWYMLGWMPSGTSEWRTWSATSSSLLTSQCILLDLNECLYQLQFCLMWGDKIKMIPSKCRLYHGGRNIFSPYEALWLFQSHAVFI